MNYERLESTLKKCAIVYDWCGTKQTNELNSITNFIYDCKSYKELYDKAILLEDSIMKYAFVRFYNFWSAQAVEDMFCECEGVKHNKNRKSIECDFFINGVPFDHKTSVFPKGFKKSYQYALEHKEELIRWLYDNQSDTKRKHFANKLYIVLFREDGNHYLMKSSLSLLNSKIKEYMQNYSLETMPKIQFEDKEARADIIFIKE